MRPARSRLGLLVWVCLAGFSPAAPLRSDAGPQGVTVSGRAVTSDQAPLQSGAVLMNPESGDALASAPADAAQFLPDGSFAFHAVRPGVYHIRARAQTTPGGVTLFGGYRVHVADRDVTGIRLVLRPGAIVSGRIEAAPGERTLRDFTGVRVRAPFVDGSSFADSLTGLVQKDGTFRIAGVMEGDHYLALEGLREPWVLAQALWRGADLADASFTAESGMTIDGVRILVSTQANQISGVVRDSAGRPVDGAAVLISPSAATRWLAGSRRFVRIETDASGRYRHRGLPPGEYRVIATRDPAATRLEARARAGTLVRFGSVDTREVDLVLMPQEAKHP